jgi:hypothetical protein
MAWQTPNVTVSIPEPRNFYYQPLLRYSTGEDLSFHAVVAGLELRYAPVT